MQIIFPFSQTYSQQFSAFSWLPLTGLPFPERANGSSRGNLKGRLLVENFNFLQGSQRNRQLAEKNEGIEYDQQPGIDSLDRDLQEISKILWAILKKTRMNREP